MNWFRNLPIRRRFMLAVAFLVVCVALSIVGFFPARQYDATHASLVQRARLVAESLAYTVAVAVEFEDEKGVDHSIQGARKDPTLEYAVVLRPDGTALAAHAPEKAPRGQRSVGAVETFETEDTLHVVAPIGADAAGGAVLLGFSLQPLRQAHQANRMVTLGISLALLLVGLGFASVITGSIARTISDVGMSRPMLK